MALTLGSRKNIHLVLAAFLALLAAVPSAAIPSFAVQTGQNCQACHVGGFGPQLTPYGREFKIRGYTTRAVNFNVPISAQVIASYVSTRANQAASPAAWPRTRSG